MRIKLETKNKSVKKNHNIFLLVLPFAFVALAVYLTGKYKFHEEIQFYVVLFSSFLPMFIIRPITTAKKIVFAVLIAIVSFAVLFAFAYSCLGIFFGAYL